MSNDYTLIIIACILVGIAAIIGLIILAVWNHNPYEYPYKTFYFDVSGKRQPKLLDNLDEDLNKNGIDKYYQASMQIYNWKNNQVKELQGKKDSAWKRHRIEQYNSVIDDVRAITLVMVRKQTRYKQVNYQKYAYQVDNAIERQSFSYDYIVNRYNALRDIGFETTISKYNAKKQRNLMTPALRDEIAFRDNYTCQCCGKYMPDRIGMHIDHIIPIARGGKTVPSNLQVLCDKCNLKKSAKTENRTTCANCGAPLNSDGSCSYCGTKPRIMENIYIKN